MLVSIWGFMGAGKSTVGRELAFRLDWKHLDSDEEIEGEDGRSIKMIFENSGEEYFRSLEKKFLKRILQKEGSQSSGNDSILLTTGGGMPICTENRELLKKLGKSIFIHVPLEQIIERLKLDEDRPLWNHEQLNLMRERFATRLPNYQEADHIIHAHNKTVEEIVVELNHLIQLGK